MTNGTMTTTTASSSFCFLLRSYFQLGSVPQKKNLYGNCSRLFTGRRTEGDSNHISGTLSI